jgi:protein-S-isoprenylcysteine O-methyltransferase Ste14
LVIHFIGIALTVLGYGLFLWAMTSNAFFSEVVRIQEERSHTVAKKGPYRVIRHPGYAGAILAFLGTPLLLGSWWAAIPSLIGSAGYVLRTALEDRTLHEELNGYASYSEKVHHRLLPGVW